MDELPRRKDGRLPPSSSEICVPLELNPLGLVSGDHSPPELGTFDQDDIDIGSNHEKITCPISNKVNINTTTKNLFSLPSSLKDHRRTDNNRIEKCGRVGGRKLALINYPLTLTLLLLLPLASNIINFNVRADPSPNPNPLPVPVRISSSYAKAPRYNSNTHNYKAYGSSTLSLKSNPTDLQSSTPKFTSTTTTSTTTSTSTVRSTTDSHINNHKDDDDENANNSNATRTISSKNYVPDHTKLTSINRPFYTKITSDDAVAKPSSFVNSFRIGTTAVSTTTKKPKRSQTSKPSPFIPSWPSSTTEKSSQNANKYSNYSSPFLTSSDTGPKIRLEPFFNLLTNFQSLALGTSKEQKFSPSYQTITQSINEHTKRSRGKGTKGMREKKRRRNKGHKGHGPIPIPIPKPLIDPEELASENKMTYVHPLDVLNVPMIGGTVSFSRESIESLPTAESLKSLESITKPNTWPYKTTQRSGDRNKPISGLDEGNKTGQAGPESRERRLRSDFFQNFHDQDVELQADESVMEPHDAMADEGGLYSESDDQIRPPINPTSQTNSNSNPHSKKGGRKNANIPPGYTHQSDIQAAPSGPSGPGPGSGQPPFYSTIYSGGSGNKEDIEMISKYPVSFTYNPPNHNGPNNNQNGRYPKPIPIPIPYPKSKTRPNLHSYYDPHYHNYAGFGEHHHNGPYPHYSSGYGNQGPPQYGSHYVGHTMPSGPQPSQPSQPQHFGGNNVPSTAPAPTAPSSGSSQTSTDLAQQGTSSDNSYNFETDNSVGATSSNQKIGVMTSFDLFYKEYKLLTWGAFIVLTSLAVLGVLAFLYMNNPPTEVVQARSAFSLENLLGNQQILKFLSNVVESNDRSNKTVRKKRYKKAGREMSSQLGAISKKDL